MSARLQACEDLVDEAADPGRRRRQPRVADQGRGDLGPRRRTEAGWRTHLDPASITRVVIGPHGPLLRSFNETGHLGRKPGTIRITG